MLTARCRAALSPGWTGTAADLAKLIGCVNVTMVGSCLRRLEQQGVVRKLGMTPHGPRPLDKGLRVWAAEGGTG